ncbi:MAG: trypsin-like peptidase domain-containing protein [bacterium]|nr:trypsin-like peptidase domain-containing protein [bacterium]
MTNLFEQLSSEMADIASNVRSALVQITDGNGSIGAGTIWHSDGLIITNAHVVAERDRRGLIRTRSLSVILPDGRKLPATVLAMDETNDLAALSVQADNLPVIEPGDSKALRPGQWVMALGHPWGVRDSMTAGVVIGTGDNLPEMQPGREWIALNLHLRPGHSGGPLVDDAGRLVGVNTMISGPEVGFAVPAHIVKAFLKDTLGARTVVV